MKGGESGYFILDDLHPGMLVKYRYTPGINMVVWIGKENGSSMVRVLQHDGRIVGWSESTFRTCFEVINEAG